MRPYPNFQQVLEAARDWAGREHAKTGQTWAGGRPYADHLNAVEAVLRRFGFSDETNAVHQTLLIAAMAHDLLEDTPVHPSTLRVLLGREVLVLVEAVTNSPGKNRAERHAATYPRIAATPWATVLKVADRISNLEASFEYGGHHLGMYTKEYPGFRAALYRANGPEEAMWAHLDGLVAQGIAATVPTDPAVPTASDPTPNPVVMALPQESWF